ncbi:peptidyl-prolyl cis-trans isomerase, FKBP-type family protein [Trichomonas vaginalis G3]|uniref:peptidylprolyl isomerase n=1 Tax=Trichomonas vaginalis (strain ATCC PRA-98 / G3) TaxID=412133 RepID=A2FYT1_TRIV3|nr:FKBP-type peptidyl-prolyl cis-trans isomerase family [Trichomonas vaginalis G3]EAX89933.1 peptidyl-prolyl cis-trans isomerase, FKBP-type family protein [Trichomonas vaginalis G3]KAI5550223.1 FKBP-type peptidyl-prolyl cis-trans isomerase family [Trichomonas vaginalis G3]|eukprot:XP_001302863.1 peptidyl-prolyl cis-trans isomerase, FKBP-type family protein [Trichomonas vaginalis G3]
MNAKKSNFRHSKKVKKTTFCSQYGKYFLIGLGVLVVGAMVGLALWPNPNIPKPQPYVKPGKIHVTEDKGVTKDIITAGAGEIGQDGDFAVVDYNISLPNGTLLYTDNKFKFELGAENVFKGFNIAVKSMKVNETSKFVITPKYGISIKKVPPTNIVLQARLHNLTKKESAPAK